MHRSIAPLLLLLTALSTSLACARSPGEVFARDGAAPPPHAAGRAMGLSAMAASAPEMADVGGATADRLLRKSASLGIEVPEEEVESTAARAEQIVAGAGGTTERSSRNADDSAMLDFRVPADRLDATIEALAALGETTHRSSQAVDVTDQAIDLEAKIGNLRGLRDRLRALLDRATKVEEILQIERELNRVQTQLDMLEGQQKRLLTDVAMSTLSLHVQPVDPPTILGPLGYLGAGLWWVVEKLFVIRY